MHAPKQQEMFYGTKEQEERAKLQANAQALLNKVPSVLSMDEYADLPDTQLIVDQQAMTQFKSIIESDDLFKFLCNNKGKHTDLIEELINETNDRAIGHTFNCLRMFLKPCTVALFATYYAVKASKSQDNNENCCINCTSSCLLYNAACVLCLKRCRSFKGVSDSAQKTLAARAQFMGLRPIEEEYDPESKKNK